MKSIERKCLLNKSNLSEEFYFTSLLEEAFSIGLLCKAKIEKIQMECLELLAYKSERYTWGESSSVRIELAESIAKSNNYTIGLYLKSFLFPDDAVRSLTQESISELYMKGRKIIEAKLKATKSLHYLVTKSLVETDNYTYNATIVDAVTGFFKIYNADFEAHEIHITADYPLCNPIKNLVGIEFIEKYLESVHYENLFSNYFHSEKITDLLNGYDRNYQELIFNIYEQIFTCSIGCILAKASASSLQLTTIDVEHIYALLSEKPHNEIENLINNAYYALLRELGIKSPSLTQYLKNSLATILSNILNGLKIDRLERVFIQAKYFEANPSIIFSLGQKMDNENYRKILCEIIQCRFTSDKIAIIENNVKSLADLEDLFFDSGMSTDDIGAILLKLDIVEIVALIKRHPYNSEIEAIELSEAEIEFRLCLKQFVNSMPREKQLVIERTMNLMA